MESGVVNLRIKEVSPEKLLETYKPDEIWGHCSNCENHGAVWSCPPHAFDPVEFFNGFKTAYVLIGEVALTGFESQDLAIAHYYEMRRRINRALLDFEKTVDGAVVLFAGHCDSCGECTRVGGAPCNKPELCRYSLESLGLKVSDITNTYFGEDLQWAKGKTPEKMLTVPAFLTPSEINESDLIAFLSSELC